MTLATLESSTCVSGSGEGVGIFGCYKSQRENGSNAKLVKSL